MNTNQIKKKVQAQFGKTAYAYVNSAIHTKGEDLQWMLDAAGDVIDKKVLDIATGGGHTALQFAQAGAAVIATDLTPEILQAAEKNVRQNFPHLPLQFQFAQAENLPFPDQTFDIVTCRIAPHHFADPQKFVGEAHRVLRPNGLFLLIDNVAPNSPELAKWMNEIEKQRDDSHVEAYTVATWVQWLSDVGFDLQFFHRWFRVKNFEVWARRAKMSLEGKERLERDILNLSEGIQEYLGVQLEGGKIEALRHEVGFFVGRK